MPISVQTYLTIAYDPRNGETSEAAGSFRTLSPYLFAFSVLPSVSLLSDLVCYTQYLLACIVALRNQTPVFPTYLAISACPSSSFV